MPISYLDTITIMYLSEEGFRERLHEVLDKFYKIQYGLFYDLVLFKSIIYAKYIGSGRYLTKFITYVYHTSGEVDIKDMEVIVEDNKFSVLVVSGVGPSGPFRVSLPTIPDDIQSMMKSNDIESRAMGVTLAKTNYL